MSAGSSTSLAFESAEFDAPPYNGYTIYRPIFDSWLAGRACAAGAHLLTGCLVEDLLMDGKKVTGIRIGRHDGEVRAPIIILADGVLSLLAKKQGLCQAPAASDMALGVKALFHLSEEEINRRFGLVRRQGATQEFLGCTEGIRGGGFIYTQLETLSVGLVFHLDSLKASGRAPYDLLQRFIASEPVGKTLRDARLVEYSAHVLPEGGYRSVPRLFNDGVLLAGDAAGLCYTNGLNQEGMNLAISSGFFAAETAVEAAQKGDFSSRSLSRYDERLRASFVLKDMKTFEKTVGLMHTDRLFSTYPNLVGSIMGELYRSDGTPRKKTGRLVWDAVHEAVPLQQLMADVVKGVKAGI